MNGIEWTDLTWNPIRGCSKVSEGCRNCYAESLAKRFCGHGMSYHGVCQREGWTGKVELVPSRLGEPAKVKKPSRIFVNSMSDFFHENLATFSQEEVLHVIEKNPQHTFQILTKRPERAAVVMRLLLGGRVLENLHLGVSCENQAAADARIPELLEIPAAVRWVSCEPLLGTVDLSEHLEAHRELHVQLDISGALRNKRFTGFTQNGAPIAPEFVEQELRRRFEAGEAFFPMCSCEDFDPQLGCPGKTIPALNWIVIGCESGPKRRQCQYEWISYLLNQADEAGVPGFVKQVSVNGRASRDPSEWPKDLRAQMRPGEKW